ncbi:MAG: hypothetical protein IJT04_09685 [Bacteroidales bacterium]|nr:hypothetical protein [Bacteroidales bacterium]
MQIIWHRKWIILLCCFICTASTILFGLLRNKSIPYQTNVEIYPTFIFKTTIEPWRLNPCYLTKRSLNSAHFQKQIIHFADSAYGSSLNEKNYAQRVHWNETPAHTIKISVVDKDSAASAQTMKFLLDELEVVFWHYTSTVFLERGGYRNIDIAEWENVMDTLPEHYLDIYDTEGAQFLIYDVISEPITQAIPFQTAKWSILISILSLLFSSFFILLMDGIKIPE